MSGFGSPAPGNPAGASVFTTSSPSFISVPDPSGGGGYATFQNMQNSPQLYAVTQQIVTPGVTVLPLHPQQVGGGFNCEFNTEFKTKEWNLLA